jgi:hypothetical protein
MELDEFTNRVHDQLIAAAALGDERTQQIAATLATTAHSAVRLAILDAVSAAGLEINAALFEAANGEPSPAVSIHLEGDSIRVSVTHPPTQAEEPSRPDDGEATARISLRLSEGLKSEIEQAAVNAEVSVNTWLVRAATTAVNSGSRGSSWLPGPGSWPPGPGSWPGGPGRGSNRITGWVTG